jgi:poly(3-hydroxyalkanoate) synthetase
LIAQCKESEPELRTLIEQFRSAYHQAFQADVFNAAEELTGNILKENFQEDDFQTLLDSLNNAFEQRFNRTYQNPEATLLNSILQHMTDMAEEESKLLDYGGQGPTVVFVPSLVNRAYVLDLMPEASLLRWLPGQGFRTLLLDWGWPGEAERHFTLTDYIAGRLERALMAAPGPVILAGYCMGGLLGLALALRRPDLVRSLALLATPWDFHAGPEGEARARAAAAALPGLEALMEPTGALPVDVLQTLFANLDPFGIAEKFRGFGRLEQASPAARRFVALEDWLNDGVPLAAPVARQCIGGWYGRNEPSGLTWRVAGQVVDPALWQGPAFAAIPHRDRIVPPASALALTGRLRQVKLHMAPAGHIGMVAGIAAEAALWKPLRDWLRGL